MLEAVLSLAVVSSQGDEAQKGRTDATTPTIRLSVTPGTYGTPIIRPSVPIPSDSPTLDRVHGVGVSLESKAVAERRGGAFGVSRALVGKEKLSVATAGDISLVDGSAPRTSGVFGHTILGLASVAKAATHTATATATARARRGGRTTGADAVTALPPTPASWAAGRPAGGSTDAIDDAKLPPSVWTLFMSASMAAIASALASSAPFPLS
mmetsp:Transcript_4279/g.11090  ORF Transcript_4279/g.11090 Transcript_4279/m.11090 type:complete len:210 (+) Transcript_4279:607-1236(+)